jgi:hypothetical protein
MAAWSNPSKDGWGTRAPARASVILHCDAERMEERELMSVYGFLGPRLSIASLMVSSTAAII